MSQTNPIDDSFKVERASQNEYQSESKEDLNSIDFCCCLTLSKPSFYLFLNVLDLVYATLVTMLALLFTVDDATSTVMDYLKVALGTLNILLFVLAAVAFVVYLMNTKFNTPAHKIYSIVRLVVCGIRYKDNF